MSVLFFTSELDQNAMEIAEGLREHLAGMKFLKKEDAGSLLKIRDNDVILDVVPDIEEPTLLEIEDLKKAISVPVNHTDLGSFLLKMKKIGRLNNVKILQVPGQADERTVSSIEKLLNLQAGK